MDIFKFKNLLLDLSKTKVIRVTGSYADGTQNEDSDIDFYIKPDHPDWRFRGDRRNIEKVKEVLDKYGVKVESTMIGYYFSHKCENDLPFEIEFSDLFNPRKNKLKTVDILGINFKTY